MSFISSPSSVGSGAFLFPALNMSIKRHKKKNLNETYLFQFWVVQLCYKTHLHTS